MRGDLGDQFRLGRVGQVIAERYPDTVAGRRDPDHEQARLGDEAEQMRDEPQQGGGRAGPDYEVRLLVVLGPREVVTRGKGLSHAVSVRRDR